GARNPGGRGRSASSTVTPRVSAAGITSRALRSRLRTHSRSDARHTPWTPSCAVPRWCGSAGTRSKGNSGWWNQWNLMEGTVVFDLKGTMRDVVLESGQRMDENGGRPRLAGDRVGEVLAGRYRVLRRLGAGGMGTVYLAEHVHLGRLTAVKVLCPPLCADDPAAEQRFRQEALLVARVHHPSVAEVYDFDRLPDGRFLLAMEYVVGETVAQQLERGGPFAIPEASRVPCTVADALNHVHWVGILHGDLKPQNIMLGPGGALTLLVFGVAHELAQR